MLIAILSDTHNQLARTRRALDLAREQDASMVLHCGDIEDPPIVSLFHGWTAHFVLGNCDWDRTGLAETIEEIGGTLHHRFGHLEIDGTKLAFLHGHDSELLEDLIQSAAYDYIFHGHTHVAAERRVGQTRIINPGALHRVQIKTFLLLDPATGETKSIVVE